VGQADEAPFEATGAFQGDFRNPDEPPRR
jgi:hypothetical protein